MADVELAPAAEDWSVGEEEEEDHEELLTELADALNALPDDLFASLTEDASASAQGEADTNSLDGHVVAGSPAGRSAHVANGEEEEDEAWPRGVMPLSRTVPRANAAPGPASSEDEAMAQNETAPFEEAHLSHTQLTILYNASQRKVEQLLRLLHEQQAAYENQLRQSEARLEAANERHQLTEQDMARAVERQRNLELWQDTLESRAREAEGAARAAKHQCGLLEAEVIGLRDQVAVLSAHPPDPGSNYDLAGEYDRRLQALQQQHAQQLAAQQELHASETRFLFERLDELQRRVDQDTLHVSAADVSEPTPVHVEAQSQSVGPTTQLSNQELDDLLTDADVDLKVQEGNALQERCAALEQMVEAQRLQLGAPADAATEKSDGTPNTMQQALGQALEKVDHLSRELVAAARQHRIDLVHVCHYFAQHAKSKGGPTGHTGLDSSKTFESLLGDGGDEAHEDEEEEAFVINLLSRELQAGQQEIEALHGQISETEDRLTAAHLETAQAQATTYTLRTRIQALELEANEAQERLTQGQADVEARVARAQQAAKQSAVTACRRVVDVLKQRVKAYQASEERRRREWREAQRAMQDLERSCAERLEALGAEHLAAQAQREASEQQLRSAKVKGMQLGQGEPAPVQTTSPSPTGADHKADDTATKAANANDSVSTRDQQASPRRQGQGQDHAVSHGDVAEENRPYGADAQARIRDQVRAQMQQQLRDFMQDLHTHAENFAREKAVHQARLAAMQLNAYYVTALKRLSRLLGGQDKGSESRRARARADAAADMNGSHISARC
ncbi:uncharacterized protein MONBRDRAFT_27985 [Monosiga brevicollis MX1]|uniref:Uncharacterized protein n=1 Tax=Monosiga brevicollis TaxID=81824 RepID=A9V6V8_MONBE|nr:uncharacterized protein MONBRDRAFT_27985 [Monosiga brevicollis MX1]EDQ86684.1 predicted protein [Monosiga brevicollis MX1]|eukprot:XP_001748520.1 hypothetical protein [Monosiga brevicollis MX1]